MLRRPKPGEISEKIRALREKALEEMDAEERGRKEAPELTFDHEPGSANLSYVSPDNPTGLPIFRGLHSPHVGNGKGPPM